jgi:hypothetical protein
MQLRPPRPELEISQGADAVETTSAEAARSPKARVPWRRWLREPLVHFLLIGMALFVGYRALNPSPEAGVQSNRIELTEDDLRQMSVAWLAQGRPAPTPEQMGHLVEQKVREEILYREALALGLDKDDTIVKRRLAQKMEFLAEDLSALREPTGIELEAWFQNNSERFALPPRVSFRHLYFSPDRRGPQARTDSEQVLGTITHEPADTPTAALADPFMFQDTYGDRAPEQLVGLFGLNFAQEIFKLKPGSWQGPIESGYGWHLVWIDSLAPKRVPAFEEIEAQVKTAWIEEQRAEFKRQAFEGMRARYEIFLPAPETKTATGNGPSPAKAAP